MNYRRLGTHGIRVSEISLGGWLTHGRSLADSDTSSIIRHAFDQGINFFDTADAYNAGEAEKSLGLAIRPLRRQDVVLATKCFFPITEAPNDRGLSRKHIFESVHGSLQRLGTDYIDLFQFHRYDHDTPLEESVRAMEDLIRQGKVLYWGVSEWSVAQIQDAVDIADRTGGYRPASNQPRYNILTQWIEQEVLPACERNGLGTVVFSPLAQGVLTGKYLPGQAVPAGSRGADESSNQFMGEYLGDHALLTKVQKLGEFAASHGVSLTEFSLAWALRLPGISSLIIGATSTQQVDTNVKASGLTFDDAIWAEAEAIVA